MKNKFYMSILYLFDFIKYFNELCKSKLKSFIKLIKYHCIQTSYFSKISIIIVIEF